MELGYALSSEEHGRVDLVAQRRAGRGGRLRIRADLRPLPSLDRPPGREPVRLERARRRSRAATERLDVGTGVTCPTIRIHPAIVAQAAATTAALMPGRFFLGVGTGENLNEHVLGQRWPPTELRLEMLEEAVEVMRQLWEGELVSHRGAHYTVENARLYTLPDEPLDVLRRRRRPAGGRARRRGSATG